MSLWHPSFLEQTIVINGLSKSHAMTGWRLGFIFAPADIDGPTHQEPSVFGNGFAGTMNQHAIEALTEGRDDAESMKKECEASGLHHRKDVRAWV